MRTLRRSIVLLGVALAIGAGAAGSALAAVDLTLAKARTDGPGPLPVGAAATFRLDVGNDGTTQAMGVTVVDTFPGGLTPVEAPSGCAIAGQVVTCTVPVALDQSDPPYSILLRARAEPGAADSTLTNTAVATAAGGATAQASLPVAVGPYSVLRVAASAGAAAIAAGSPVRLTAVVRNEGPSSASGVRALVRLPPGLRSGSATPTQGTCAGPACDLGGLPAGGEATIEILAAAHVFAVGRHVATVEATATSPSAPGRADVAVDVAPAPATAAAAPPPDLAVAVRPPRAVKEGAAGTWTLVVANLGAGPATAVRVRGAASPAADLVGARGAGARCGPALPVTCELGTLAPGERRTIALRLRPARPGRLVVTGSVAAAEAEATAANNLAGARRRAAAGRARLTLAARPAAEAARPGGRLAFLVTVGNRSHVTARRLKVCARTPGGRSRCWTLARLRPGGLRTYRAAGTAPGPGRATATATARAANSSPAAARAAVRVVSP